MIRKARKGRQLTQHQLALRVGTSAATVSRWENDRQPPVNKDLAALSSILGIPMDALVEAIGLPLNPALQDTLFQPLVQELSHMSLREQRSLYDFVVGASRRGDRR